MATELFANYVATTVPTGGTTAPSSGSTETWTVTSSSGFPAAVTGTSQFHVADPAQPGEVIAVTNVSGTTWSVTRGAESTATSAHTAGFTVKQVVSAGFLGSLATSGVSSVTAGDTSIVVGGSGSAPTIETGTLDVIAADHPPAANWSNNSHKITSLANGSGAQDAAAYGQTPAGGTTVTIAQGGTGQTTQQAAMNALAGTQTSGDYLRGNGTNVSMSAIQAADVPTLNQNTTGTAAGLSSTLALASGGTGQTSAAAAYNALSPMTTTGDMEYDSSGGAAARLPVGSAGQVLGVSGGVPAWGMGLVQQATTGTTGYTLVNGTGNIITWTTPNDGALHRIAVFAAIHVSSGETGGVIALTYTLPDGTASATHTLLGGAQSAGDAGPALTGLLLVKANTTVTVKQSTALTGGAAIMWAEIWGS